MNEGLNRGLFIRIRTDGKLFNLARLRAHTKTLEMCIRELLHAHDSALTANNAVDMQQIVDRSSSAADMFGLKINISKTELIYQPPPISIGLPETITVHDEALKTIDSFTNWAAVSLTSTQEDPIRHEGLWCATRDSGAVMTSAQKPK